MKNKLIILLLCALPFERLMTIEAFGFTLKLSYIVGIILIISFLFTYSDKIKLNLADKVLGFFVGWSFITTLWSSTPTKTIIYSCLYLLFYCIYLAIKNSKNDQTEKHVESHNTSSISLSNTSFPRRRESTNSHSLFGSLGSWRCLPEDDVENNISAQRKYLQLTVLVGVLLSFFSLWQYLGDALGLSAQFTFLRPEYQKGVFAFPRVQATFLEPLYYANYLVIPLLLSAVFFIKSQTKKDYFKYGFALILISLSLFLTLSRGGIVAAGIGVILFVAAYLIKFKDIKKTAQLVILFIVSVFLTFALIYSVSGQKGLNDYTAQSQKTTDKIVGDNVPVAEQLRTRESTSEIAKGEVEKHWITGIGTKAFGNLPQFALLREKGNYQTVNNQYLEVLVETGLIGLSLFLVFWLLCVKKIFQNFLKTKDLNSLAFLAIMISWLAQYMTFSSFWLLYAWVYLALFTREE